MSNSTRPSLAGPVIALCFALVAVALASISGCGTSLAVDSKPRTVSLIGEWRQINPNSGGWMTASISGESVQVNLRGRGSSSVYWMGTFDTHPRKSNKFKVVSIGDPDAAKSMIAADESKTKTFTYDHGVLSFKFSALGTSATIHMTKAKSTHIPTATPTTHRPSYKTPQTNKKPTTKAKARTGVKAPAKISTRKK